jgi:hypothetical protein
MICPVLPPAVHSTPCSLLEQRGSARVDVCKFSDIVNAVAICHPDPGLFGRVIVLGNCISINVGIFGTGLLLHTLTFGSGEKRFTGTWRRTFMFAL